MGRTSKIATLIAAVMVAAVIPCAAAPYPSGTVRLICWSSAGSPLDVMMRQLGKQFGEMFEQTFVVENRPGGEGAVAMAAVTNHEADGSMILSTTSSMSFAMATKNIQYRPDNFIVLPPLQAEPSAIAVRRDSQFETMKQFMDFMHDNPDKLSVGGFSAAGFHQYVFYRLQKIGHFKSLWVPFKGGSDAALALLGGHIDVAIMTPSSAISQLKSGDIRLLGISSAQRSEYFLDVPTFKEQGYDVVESIWRGIMVKSSTPKSVIDTLVSAIGKVKQSEQWKKFSQLNMQSSIDTSLDDMQKQVRAEVASDREFLEAIDARK
jgi:putative tricarboxylic transport membrane protein